MIIFFGGGTIISGNTQVVESWKTKKCGVPLHVYTMYYLDVIVRVPIC